MTLEEKANKHAESYGADLCNYCRECDRGKTDPCIHLRDAKFGHKDGYIAGAKENGTVWHKVADGDLPKDEQVKLIYGEDDIGVVKTIAYYDTEEKEWVWYDMERRIFRVIDIPIIAWTEIHKYEVEE